MPTHTNDTIPLFPVQILKLAKNEEEIMHRRSLRYHTLTEFESRHLAKLRKLTEQDEEVRFLGISDFVEIRFRLCPISRKPFFPFLFPRNQKNGENENFAKSCTPDFSVLVLCYSQLHFKDEGMVESEDDDEPTFAPRRRASSLDR